LLAEGVPSARHRAGGRHCLYRLETDPGSRVTPDPGSRSPERLPPRAGSSSDFPLFRPLRKRPRADATGPFGSEPLGRGKTDQESRASGRSPKTHRPCAGIDRATRGENPPVGIPRVDCSTQSPAGMNRPPARAPGLVVQGDAERAHLPGVAPEGSGVPTPRSGGGSDRIGNTCRR